MMSKYIKNLFSKLRELERSGRIDNDDCRQLKKELQNLHHAIATGNRKAATQHLSRFCNTLGEAIET